MTTGEQARLGADPAERLRRHIEAVRQAVRRENGEEKELGPKAERTRARLLEAAREVFAERDYFATSAADIAERAGVSLGTFYQYFTDLNGIVTVLAGEQVIEMLSQHVNEWDPRTGRLGLRRVLLVFLRGYFANVAFYRLWEQVTAVDPRIAEIRRRFWAAYKHEIEKSLEAGMAAGTVRTDIPAGETARALTHMIERYCYDAAIFDPPPAGASAEDAADLLTTLWADAIGLAEPSARWQDSRPPAPPDLPAAPQTGLSRTPRNDHPRSNAKERTCALPSRPRRPASKIPALGHRRPRDRARHPGGGLRQQRRRRVRVRLVRDARRRVGSQDRGGQGRAGQDRADVGPDGPALRPGHARHAQGGGDRGRPGHPRRLQHRGLRAERDQAGGLDRAAHL